MMQRFPLALSILIQVVVLLTIEMQCFLVILPETCKTGSRVEKRSLFLVSLNAQWVSVSITLLYMLNPRIPHLTPLRAFGLPTVFFSRLDGTLYPLDVCLSP